jgi:hypothetical protein
MLKVFSFSFLLLSTQLIGQEFKLTHFNLTGGNTFSTFLYTNSEGKPDQGLHATMLNSFGINGSIIKGKNCLRPELLFRQAGAISGVNTTSVEWKLNYLDFNVGFLYSIIRSNRSSLSPGIATGISYMLNGEQFIGTTRYSLTETKALSRLDATVTGILQYKNHVSENVDLSIEYRAGMGLMQIERDVNAQKTHNFCQSILLGIGFKIK